MLRAGQEAAAAQLPLASSHSVPEHTQRDPSGSGCAQRRLEKDALLEGLSVEVFRSKNALVSLSGSDLPKSPVSN